MSKTKETEFSEEGVPLADQEWAAANADTIDPGELEVELRDIGPVDEERRLTEDEAADQADVINEVVERPKHVQGDRAQDHLAFDNARRDEAIAQGVVKTTQEKLWELARQEEANGQGVAEIGDTTQKSLFREARAEEVRAEKWEESQHGPVVVPVEQVDRVAENERLAKESKQDRKTAEQKDAEIQKANKAVKRSPSKRKTAAASK